jgi:hypothetical protein
MGPKSNMPTEQTSARYVARRASHPSMKNKVALLAVVVDASEFSRETKT